MTRPMTVESELDRVTEQVAGLSLPEATKPLPLKDATPAPEFKNPRKGADL